MPSFAPERLRQAGELGWLGMLVPSSADGLGLGLTELALVLEQAGRGLVCEPIGLAAIAAAALAQGHAPHPMLQRAMRGDGPGRAGAAGERARRRSACAAHAGDGADGAPRLTGTKTFVCADGADGFLVSASGRDGPALYYVARDAPGVQSDDNADGRRPQACNP